MSGQDTTEPKPGGENAVAGVTARLDARSGARWWALGAATAALGGSLWAALGGTGCDTCGGARQLVAEMPLAWAGVVFYAALGAGLAWRGLTRWTSAGVFAAAGVHMALLTLLALRQIVCSPCILTGVAALLGAATCFAAQPRTAARAAVVFTSGMLLAFGGIATARHFTPPPATRPLAETEPVRELAKGRVRMIVYERPGCYKCLMFEEQFVPRLIAALGDSLEIERREAEIDMESPTIYIEGKGRDRYVGLPVYEDLEKTLMDLRVE